MDSASGKNSKWTSMVPHRGGSRCKWLKLWSGLSESNRHLNLGKVPYYHYTKAAQLHFFL
jgi:hypothetical protein